MAHPIFYRLAACVNTADGVLRLHEVSAEDHTLKQAFEVLKARRAVTGTVFWSLYAYYNGHPSEWLADCSAPSLALRAWADLTGYPEEAVDFNPDHKFIDLPAADPVQIGVTVAAVLEGAHSHPELGEGLSRLDTADRLATAAVYAHVKGELIYLKTGFHEGSWYDIAAVIGVALGAVFRPGIPAAQLLEVVDQSIATYTEALRG